MNEKLGDAAALPCPPAQALAHALDRLAWPMLALSTQGVLLESNAAARRLLAEGHLLREAPGRRVVLAAALHQARFTTLLQSVAQSGQSAVFVARGRQGLSATLSPLPKDKSGRDAVMVALAVPDGHSTETRDFADEHGFNDSERRVLERLALGESSSRAATVLGVLPATIRSQIVSMRRKAGQDSVVSMLRALSAKPPLASPE